MKKRLLWLMAIAGLVATMACTPSGNYNINKVKLSGVTVTRTLPISGTYTEIDVSNAIEVQITDSVDQLTVTADSCVIKYLNISVVNNKLVVALKKNTLWIESTIKVCLPYQPGVNSIDLSGASICRLDKPITLDDFELELSGASSFIGNVAAHKINAELSGASSVEGTLVASIADVEASGASSLYVDGNIEALEVELSGASEWEPNQTSNKEVFAGRITGDVSGASEMHAISDGTIAVHLNGASILRYRGGANTTSSEISGGSTIEKL